MVQEYKQGKDSSSKYYVNEFKGRKTCASEVREAELSPPLLSDPTYVQHWKDYVTRLSTALSYFLLDAKENALCRVLPSSSRNTILVSTVYAELSVKWFMSVLHTVFPCIKACSDKKEIPSHLRCQLFCTSFSSFTQVYNCFILCICELVISFLFHYLLCFSIYSCLPLCASFSGYLPTQCNIMLFLHLKRFFVRGRH